MALHLENTAAWNVNSQLTWIEIFMLSAATVLGIFHEKVSSWKTQPSMTVMIGPGIRTQDSMVTSG